MKNFTYFQSTDGGMSVVSDIRDFDDFNFLSGWMNNHCILGDKKMLDWTETAEVGQKFDHRLGCLVRMADKKKTARAILKVNGWTREADIPSESLSRGSVEIFLEPPLKFVKGKRQGVKIILWYKGTQIKGDLPLFEHEQGELCTK